MSNWYKEVNSKKHLEVNHQINQLIPEGLTNEYYLDEVWITTFSLEFEQLELLLEDIGATTLIGNDKVHVFYDGYTQSPIHESNKIISDKCLKPVKLDNNGTLYAFHPKVMLLRYVNKDKCRDKCRYVILVLSKNVSKANLLDAFSVAYADVKGSKGQSIVEAVGETNGAKIYGFWENVYKKCLGKDIEIPDEIGKLKGLNFHQENNASVSFLNAGEVLDKMANQKELIIVSPFLSDDTILKVSSNLKLLLSEKNSFARLKKKNIENLIEGSKCIYLSENMDLHAKIYVWKENNKTCWIVGSSNFTNNGCDINKSNGNIEYNMYFETEETGYDEFLELLNSVGNTFSMIDYNVLHSEAEQTFNPRQIFYDLCNRIEVEVKYNEQDKKYSCLIKKNTQNTDKDKNIEIIFPQGEAVKFNDIANQGYTFTSNPIIPSFIVCISDDEGNSREFRYSLYDLWKEKELDNEIDEICQRAYLEHLEILQNRIWNGTSLRKTGERIRNNKTTSNKRKTTDKLYIYEQLMKISLKIPDKDQFMQELEKLRKYNEAILKINSNDIKQKKLQEILRGFVRNE